MFSQLLSGFDPHKPLTQEDIAQITGLKVATIAKWRQLGKGPRYFRVNQTVRYTVADVRAWLESQCCGCGGEQLARAAGD